LIKILIVNFHYDLITAHSTANTGCAVCSNFTKERRIYEHVRTYFVYNYILVSRGDCYVLRLLCFFFRFLFFET